MCSIIVRLVFTVGSRVHPAQSRGCIGERFVAHANSQDILDGVRGVKLPILSPTADGMPFPPRDLMHDIPYSPTASETVSRSLHFPRPFCERQGKYVTHMLLKEGRGRQYESVPLQFLAWLTRLLRPPTIVCSAFSGQFLVCFFFLVDIF